MKTDADTIGTRVDGLKEQNEIVLYGFVI